MPNYNYDCQSCGNNFDSIEKFDTEITYCTKCGKISKRNHTPTMCEFNLLGSAWHRDGYTPAHQKNQINKKLIAEGRETEII